MMPTGETGPPVPEHLHQASLADIRGVLRKFPLAVGRAKVLRELTEDFAFFTPAPLYVAGAFTDGPLIDFARQHPGFRIYHKLFEKPLFAGLDASDGDPSWNFGLWAVEQSFWSAFSDFLVSSTLLVPAQQCMIAIGLQEILVTDPLAADQALLYTQQLPRLVVGVFGVRTARYIAVINPGEPPGLAFYPGDAAVARMQRAIFQSGGVQPLERQQ